MEVYICTICGFSYDEKSAEQDIAEKPIPFTELENDWLCPNCGTTPDHFNPAPPEDDEDRF
jgi:rubredoxin